MEVHIITGCFNVGPHIEVCLGSAAEQTNPNIVHLIVDGVSLFTRQCRRGHSARELAALSVAICSRVHALASWPERVAAYS